MRISDWSSDVCSSDLLPWVPAIDEISTTLRKVSSPAAASCLANRRIGSAAARRIRKGATTWTSSIFWNWSSPIFWTTPSSVRSEEHTSELQSLMRISYAVFCLKKKKNKKVYNQISDNIQQEQ